MSVEVVMPKFGLTMQQGTIQQWFRTEGESVSAGDPLFEVETEKVLYEVEAPADGVVATILYPVESVVAVGVVVAVIAAAGEDAAEVASRYAKTAVQAAPAIPAGPVSPGEFVREQSPVAAPTPTEITPSSDRVIATPAARKLAKEKDIDLARVKGTGPGGRVTREDVENALTAPPAAPEAAPWQGMRKRIAARMFQSLQTSAQLTITTEADVTDMVHRRARLHAGQPITYNDLLVHAVGRALREHPRLNATVDGQGTRVQSEVNVGVAVALDEGLIVPVIRNADRKSPAEIAQESRELAEKARAGTVAVDEVSGGSFTVSNLGMYGVDAFTPIIDLPQVAILGVGRVREKPVVYEGEIAIRHTLTLSLTFDHRAVDGVPAAQFLQSVVRHLTTGEE
jgi:pyruvate dehydrogenase E2 component (dihydrolipoamide acetyltransferase)